MLEVSLEIGRSIQFTQRTLCCRLSGIHIYALRALNDFLRVPVLLDSNRTYLFLLAISTSGLIESRKCDLRVPNIKILLRVRLPSRVIVTC